MVSQNQAISVLNSTCPLQSCSWKWTKLDQVLRAAKCVTFGLAEVLQLQC